MRYSRFAPILLELTPLDQRLQLDKFRLSDRRKQRILRAGRVQSQIVRNSLWEQLWHFYLGFSAKPDFFMQIPENPTF